MAGLRARSLFFAAQLSPAAPGRESTGTSFTFWTGDMVYKPLAARVALIAGFRRALPVFRYMIVAAVAVVMWESPQGFPRGVGRVESRLMAFHAFHTPAFPLALFFWSPRRANSHGRITNQVVYEHESEVILHRSTLGFPWTILIPAITKPFCFHSSLVA